MKLQNKETQNKIKVLSILTIIICISSIVFIYLNIKNIGFKDDLIFILSLLILIYLTYLGCPYFKYDSDGETLIFQNKKSLPTSIFVKECQSDFPKRKLKKFNVRNKMLFKKTLEVYITSKRVTNGLSKLKFDISYLSNKQIRNMKMSLEKVIKENKELERLENNS